MKALFLTAFIIGLTGAMSPGPLLTITISRAVRQGFWVGPLISAGHGVVELVLFIGLLSGLSGFLARPAVAAILGVAGGAVLIILGYATIKDTAKGFLSSPGQPEPISVFPAWRTCVAGGVTSLSNPYWWIWWATMGSALVAQSIRYGFAGQVIFFTGHLLSDLLWYSLVAAAISSGRHLVGTKAYLIILKLCGVILILLGGYFLFNGLMGRILFN